MTLLAALLLIPTTLLHYAYADTPPTTTSLLIPPYGSGPATYYASALGSNDRGTSYKITCIAPATTTGRCQADNGSSCTSTPTLTSADTDPCRTSSFGTAPVTFFQGPAVWQVIRSTSVSGHHSTACSTTTVIELLSVSTETYSATCEAVPTPFVCNVSDEEPGGKVKRRTDVEMCRLGFREQVVHMVETFPTPSVSGFSDIGKSATTQGPVATVTLILGPKSIGKKRTIGRGMMLLTVAAAVAGMV